MFLLGLTCAAVSHAQGGIEHIKNQEYLKNTGPVDCDNSPETIYQRICANLAYQKSDSLLVVAYQNLLKLYKDDKKMVARIQTLQQRWRTFRDEHCGIVWDNYTGGSLQAIVYLYCLKELTDHRTTELKSLDIGAE